MLKRRTVLWLFSSLFIIKEINAQTAAEKLDYLQKNIRIWVLHQPNLDTPSFYSVKPTGVFLDTDGIIMGKKNNNGMGKSADFLSALFKDGSKQRNGGDQPLQDITYWLLKNINKPVDVYFINDVKEGVNDSYLEKYGLYITKHELYNRVFPATFEAKDTSTSQGQIILGGKNNERIGEFTIRREFVFLLSKLVIGSYSDIPTLGIFEINEPVDKYGQSDRFYFLVGRNDVRYTLTDAISLSFLIADNYIVSKKNYLKDELFKWLGSGPRVLIKDPQKINIANPVPDNSLLNNIIGLKGRSEEEKGGFVTAPPFPLPKGQTVQKDKKVHALYLMPDGFLIRNEFVSGLLLSYVLQKTGKDKFFEYIKNLPDNFNTTDYFKQLPALIASICKQIYEDKTPQRINAGSNGYLFPLAIADFFLNFPETNSFITELPDEVLTKKVLGLSFTGKKIKDEYLRIRPLLIKNIKKAYFDDTKTTSDMELKESFWNSEKLAWPMDDVEKTIERIFTLLNAQAR